MMFRSMRVPAFSWQKPGLFWLAVAMVATVGCHLESRSTKAGYSFRSGGESASRTDSGTFPKDLSSLRVKNHFGAVTVSTTSGPPSWTWLLTVRGDSQEQAESIADQCILEVREGADASLTLVLPDPAPKGFRGVESTLELALPAQSSAHIENRFGRTSVAGRAGATELLCSHGEIDLKDMRGWVDAKTSFASLNAERISSSKLRNQHGSITVDNVKGDLRAETSFGTVTVQDVAGDLDVVNKHGRIEASDIRKHARISTTFATIDLRNVGGDANIKNQHGRIITEKVTGRTVAKTSFATMTIDVASADVDCTNSHGSIGLQVRSANLRHLKATTSYANIKIALDPTVRPVIEATTSFGKVHSDYPVLRGDVGVRPEVGDDEARVTLENKHGNITIRRGS